MPTRVGVARGCVAVEVGLAMGLNVSDAVAVAATTRIGVPVNDKVRL